MAMYFKHYPLTKMLIILLVVLIIFFFVGDTIRFVYEKFRPEELDDGEENGENVKEIIADDDVEEEYHPQADEDMIPSFEENQQMEEENTEEADGDEDATGETSEDDFQEEEYTDSEEFEES